MHRTIVQLDDPLMDQLRQMAFETRQSLSAVMRDLLHKALRAKKPTKARHIKDLRFVGSGRGGVLDGSVQHDKYLADDFLK